MDAPATWVQGITVSDITEVASGGTMVRKVLVTILGLVGTCCLMFGNRGRIRINGAIAWLFITYLSWIGLSAIWADDPGLTTKRQIALAMTLLFAGACAARMNADVLSAFIAGIPLLNLVPGLVAELRYGDFHPLATDNRFTGIAVHPNVEAASLSLAAILVCGLAWRARGPVRFALACTSLVLITFLFMTGSRTSVLAFGIAGMFLATIIVLRDQKRRLPLLLAALAVTVGITGITALVAASTSTKSNLLSALNSDRGGDVTTGNGRLDLWKACMSFAAQHPLLGFGFGGFWTEKRIEMISDDQGWPIQQSHCAYIDQVLALGFPGSVLYILLLFGCLFACLTRFFRNHDSYGGWAGVLLVIIIVNFTESINISPVFPNFAFNLIVVHLALVNPWTEEGMPDRP